MNIALNTFSQATSRKLDNALIFQLTHQVVILIESAANYNPAAITAAVINQAIQDTVKYFKLLDPKVADTLLEICPALRSQHDPVNTACASVRRNLVEMGYRIRRNISITVKASEVLKAALRDALYRNIYQRNK